MFKKTNVIELTLSWGEMMVFPTQIKPALYIQKKLEELYPEMPHNQRIYRSRIFVYLFGSLQLSILMGSKTVFTLTTPDGLGRFNPFANAYLSYETKPLAE